MNGSGQLSEEEKLELLQDARNIERGKAFLAARVKSQEGTLDEYIGFLSEHIEICEFEPSKKVTEHYKL